MKKKLAIVSCVAILFGSTAAAEESGVYVSASVGAAHSAKRSVLILPGRPRLTGDAPDGDLTWSGTLGYQFNRNFAIELGYLDLGDLSSTVSDATGDSDARANIEFAASGLTYAFVGTFPLGAWTPYVKAGAIFADTSLKYRGTQSALAFQDSYRNHSMDPLVGAGVKYSLNDSLKIYFDSTYLHEVGEPTTGKANFLNTSLGLHLQF